jgi:hypothetical protein
VAQAQSNWAPTLTNLFQTTSTDSPNNTFLAGGQGLKTSDDRFINTTGIQQSLRWGGRYNLSFDGSRLTTNNLPLSRHSCGPRCPSATISRSYAGSASTASGNSSSRA